MEKAILSKSTFIRGLQCLKSLYLYKNRYFLRDPLLPEQRIKFARGHEVGDLAQQLYPGGIDLRPKSPRLYRQAVEKTQEAISSGESIIYEAGFQFNAVLVFLDILVNQDGKWYAYEVKSSKSISDTYVMDASLQYYVISNSGIEIEDFFLVHMDESYVLEDKIDIHRLFKSVGVKAKALENQDFIKDFIQKEKDAIVFGKSPEIPIGAHCNSPYPCDFIGHCWKKIPSPSVFSIPSLSDSEKFGLYDEGHIQIEDISEKSGHTDIQQKQISSYKANKAFIEPDAFKQMIGDTDQPIYFVKILYAYPAVPLYQGYHAYELLPYACSVIKNHENNPEVVVDSFYVDPGADPKNEITSFLEKTITGPGTIIFYGQEAAFHQVILSDKLKLVDLYHVFSENIFFSPEIDYSKPWDSIKEKLLSEQITPEKGLNDIIAASLYLNAGKESDLIKRQETKEQLLAFAKSDVFFVKYFYQYLQDFAKTYAL